MHRILLSIALGVATALWSNAVHATCNVFASCEGSHLQVRLSVIHGGEEPYTGILIHRSTNGICDSATVLNQEDPLPWPEEPFVIHDLYFQDLDTVSGVSYVYWATLLDGYGNEHVNSTQVTQGIAGCGDPPLTEGVLTELEWETHGLIAPACDCWWTPYCVELVDLPPSAYEPLLGMLIAVRGHYVSYPMLGDCRLRAESVSLIWNCDAPVSTQPTTWGTLKSLYR
jgi:hypothetical protein